jgi:hypothetical protein
MEGVRANGRTVVSLFGRAPVLDAADLDLLASGRLLKAVGLAG